MGQKSFLQDTWARKTFHKIYGSLYLYRIAQQSVQDLLKECTQYVRITAMSRITTIFTATLIIDSFGG